MLFRENQMMLSYHIEECQVFEFASIAGNAQVGMIGGEEDVRAVIVDAIPEMSGRHQMQKCAQIIGRHIYIAIRE